MNFRNIAGAAMVVALAASSPVSAGGMLVGKPSPATTEDGPDAGVILGVIVLGVIFSSIFGGAAGGSTKSAPSTEAPSTGEGTILQKF
ncbi:MAG: hypothetical protein AAFO58_08940 [Pseudomonadota bacterium]